MPRDDAIRAAKAEAFLAEAARWAGRRGDVAALALVGSWARRAARLDSDIDLVLLTERPQFFRENQDWLDEIDWDSLGLFVAGWHDAEYGDIWSRHVRLGNRRSRDLLAPAPPAIPVIEFGFGRPDWASVEPLESGAARVVREGCRILFDPQGLLARLVWALQASA